LSLNKELTIMPVNNLRKILKHQVSNVHIKLFKTIPLTGSSSMVTQPLWVTNFSDGVSGDFGPFDLILKH
jgi:hypothetical protein